MIKSLINKIICNDNLNVLSKLENEYIDLIYIDPPYYSNIDYQDFNDTWKNLDEYLEYMKKRLIEIYRILKKTGSFYLHADYHAIHYLKVICDEIFGYNNFRNEIIWNYSRWTNGKNWYQRMHDTILFYTKSDNYIFNSLTEPFSKKSKHKGNRHTSIKDGIVNQKYVSDKRIKSKSDVWNISILNSQSKERLGYATQKPEKLIEIIVRCSSNENDIVLDCFCGSGTTLSVSKRLNRKYIGIDNNIESIKICKKRLTKIVKNKGLI